MNVLDIMKYGNRTLLNALNGLPENDWEASGVCGVWSVKDVIAHLASYEHVLAEVLNSFLDGGETPYLEAFIQPDGEFNDDQVAQRRRLSGAEVYAEYQAGHEKSMSLASRIPPDIFQQNGTLPWYGERPASRIP